MQWLEKPTPRE